MQPPEPLRGVNLVATNTALLEAVRREGAGWAEERLVAFGGELGGEPLEWGREANEHPPVLHGNEVEFHPSWHRLLELGLRERLHTLGPAPGAHVARAAAFYALAQVEAGVGCPLSMTNAAAPALRREPALAAEWEPRLAAGALCGMSMTERQGGSDVRANETVARRVDDDNVTLHGHKWFCSAPMSDVFLMLAQAPGGLTCYLVPRDGIVFERLKDKLGNRSNASAEIRLDGTPARRVGEEGRGVATIIEMVVHTRLDCVVGSAALMRQAVAQALHFCAKRTVFGRVLTEQPLMQNVLADLCVESEAATVAALRLARAFDEGDELRRVATAVLKYWVCKRGVAAVAEALECLGGNGYVEDFGELPRLYRESPLNGIWEGSSNVQCLDVLRALHREPDAAARFLDELEPVDRAAVERALGDADEGSARRVVETMAVALQGSLLDRHGDPAVAQAFRAREPYAAFGTLPRGLDLQAILRRSGPGVEPSQRGVATPHRF